MARDLSIVAKRITKMERDPVLLPRAQHPVILYWGGEPASGFEELDTQRDPGAEEQPGKKKRRNGHSARRARFWFHPGVSA